MLEEVLVDVVDPAIGSLSNIALEFSPITIANMPRYVLTVGAVEARQW